MPQPKNQLLRVLVPLLAAAAGIGVAVAVFRGSNKAATPPSTTTTTTTPTTTTNPATPAAPGPDAAQPEAPPKADQAANPAPTPDGAPGANGATPAAPTAPASTVTPTAYRALVYTNDPLALAPAALGSNDKGSKFKALVEFSASGAGVRSMSLTDHFESIKELTHVVVQREHVVARSDRSDAITPLGALAVEITPPGGAPVIVPLASAPNGRLWKQVSPDKPGAFEAVITDADGTPVLRIERQFALSDGSHDLRLSQKIVNLSGQALTVRWYQSGPVDLDPDAASYGGDKRRMKFGYLLPAAKDPTRSIVVSDEYLIARSDVLGPRTPAGFADKPLWPNKTSIADQYDLVWAGMTNRYYGVTVHPIIDPAAAAPNKMFTWVDTVDRIVLDAGSGHEVLALRLASKKTLLAPAGTSGSALDISHGFYAGPLSRREIKSEPLLASLGIAGLVVYNFGGMCGPCTFGFMTDLLLWLLLFLHDILRDWALAILCLVLIVRTCLHPVTKWSQIRMARFGKQMQAVGPKQKALQEKFKDDQAKLREETGKLWREEGISPTGFLGCLPAFLQTPVWIALYATLYFAVELRHQPAFYGLFQAILPKDTMVWWFLGDLAEPDRLIYFGKALVEIPLLGPIASVNILPVILGVVFYIQQKYLTPPTTMSLTPEQEFQQKMVKWMMVFMFPLMMYNAPSGLALYFICNSTLGILESRYVRSHMDKYGMLDLDKMKAERQAKLAVSGRGSAPAQKQKGFFAKLQEIAEQKQRQAMGQRGQKPGKR